MIIVDSSVWVDYFNGIQTWQTDLLDNLLEREPILIGDLILTEILQGFSSKSDYQSAKAMLSGLPYMDMLGRDLALTSTQNYRYLRKKGVTVRKTMDVMIATFCAHHQFSLLHCDHDFDIMGKYLGLDIINSDYLDRL